MSNTRQRKGTAQSFLLTFKQCDQGSSLHLDKKVTREETKFTLMQFSKLHWNRYLQEVRMKDSHAEKTAREIKRLAGWAGLMTEMIYLTFNQQMLVQLMLVVDALM